MAGLGDRACRRSRIFGRSVLLFFVLSVCDIAAAFESDEHRLLGDLALRLALQIAPKKVKHSESEEGQARLERIAAINRDWSNGGNSGARAKDQGGVPYPSYGEVVMCVDYFLFPEKMLAASFRAEPGQTGRGLPSREGASLINVSAQCATTSIAYMQASQQQPCALPGGLAGVAAVVPPDGGIAGQGRRQAKAVQPVPGDDDQCDIGSLSS